MANYWKEEYLNKLRTAEEAVREIRDGDTVILGHCVAEPKALVDAMVANAQQYHDVEVRHMFSLGDGEYAAPQFKGHLRATPFFVSANVRTSIAEGHGDFTPVFFHEVPKLIREKRIRCDVLMTQVTPPDKNGYCSLGTSVDYTLQALHSARTVIVQVNENLPWTMGNHVHISEFDYIVEQTEPLYESAPPKIGEVETAIGRYCASLVEDGATLQLGIGAIPDAVVRCLGDRKDLGIHSEMISDGILDLCEKGVITGRKKTLDKGEIVVTFLMGTRRLYDFVNHNPVVKVLPVDYVNNPLVIMQQKNMVSINAALKVDLMGQVSAESIGLKQFSGVGGQVDFIRGVAMSENGKAIIAMPSLAHKKDGTTVSKIVPYLEEGEAVTTSRNDVDYIVTEYGIARMKGHSLKERAANLIRIAHPDFRDALGQEYERRFHEPWCCGDDGKALELPR